MRNVRSESTLRAACLLVVACVLLLAAGTARADYDMVVAQDGTGDYTTVGAAIAAVPYFKHTRTTIYIKSGTYKEKLTIPKGVIRVTLVGEDRDTTILTYDDHATVNDDDTVDGTIDSTSFFIKGKDFGARNITFSNTAGDVGPAIAVWVHGNRAHFRNCAFLGYQDTLCATADMVYFKRCYIEGAVDFIFGSSAAVFQRCTIHPLGYGYITAADTAQGKPYGFVFKGCVIHGDADAGAVYLGRPWGDDANVVYLNCEMDDEIIPVGWDDWLDETNHATVSYAEYNSTGAGADPTSRVDWSQQLTADDADEYTLGKIFGLPTANVFGPSLLTATTPWYEDY